MIQDIKPIPGKILLSPIMDEYKTKSGIYMAPASKPKVQEAEVMAVGAEVDLKVGDVVVYDKYAGKQVKDGETIYLMVKNDDILAIVQQDES